MSQEQGTVKVRILTNMVGYEMGKVYDIPAEKAEAMCAPRANGQRAAEIVGAGDSVEQAEAEAKAVDVSKMTQHELSQLGMKNVVSLDDGVAKAHAIRESELTTKRGELNFENQAAADKELAEAKKVAEARAKAADDEKSSEEQPTGAEGQNPPHAEVPVQGADEKAGADAVSHLQGEAPVAKPKGKK